MFNSVQSFDEWFNSPFAAATGQEKIELNEEEQLLIIRRLHKVLRPFLLRRLKKDVESELPDKVETIVKCPMSALQKRLYEQIRSRRFGNDAFAKKKALNNLVMQFRKICNHPYVFDEVEEAINPSKQTDENLFRVAGKFELLDRILPKFQASDHRVLMFFQMTQIMDIMEDFLRWRGFTYLRLDGQTKPEDRTSMLKTFNKSDNPPFIFLLSTRAGGLGLNLQTADTVIIYDSDWNPHQDLQAQDRAHRIGQKKEVRILRLITSKSVEETILARAQYKLDIDGKVIQAGKFDNKTSDREREELLRSLFGADEEEEESKEKEEKDDKDEKEATEGPKYDGEIDDNELNEIIARNEGELELFGKMDAERKKREADAWKARGGRGAVPLRLMQDNELPSVFLEEPPEPEDGKVTTELYFGRGGRQRKTVAYDDGLNEEQWLNAIDQGDLDGFIAKKQARKERKEKRLAAKGAEVDVMELPDPEEDTDSVADYATDQTGNGRKRSRGEGAAARESSPPNKYSDSRGKRGKKDETEHFAGVNPDKPDTLDPQTRAALTRVFKAVYKAVEEVEVEEEDYTRRRCELYLSLPDRTDYADYYMLIKEPVAMDMIYYRLTHSYYKSLQDFVNDFQLMFRNSMQYNAEGSPVWNDAVEMKKVFEAAVNQLCPNGVVPIPHQGS